MSMNNLTKNVILTPFNILYKINPKLDLELNDLGECFKKIKSKNNGLVKWENKDPMAIINMIDNFIQENWK